MRGKSVDILYVEDDAMDVDLAKSALDTVCDASYRMDVVEDGEQALRFLNGREPYKDAKAPDVILLDLNLPKIHGREVLKTVKESKRLRKIPVIVFTTSQLQEDVEESYELGASGYLTKPTELRAYQQTFKAICDFWFKSAALPRKPKAEAI